MGYDDVAAGNLIIASETREALDERAYGVLKRGRRTSSSTTTTGEQSVLRIDDQALTFGRLYRIACSTLVLDGSVANDVIRANIRYTTDGSTPTTSSTLLVIDQAIQPNVSFPVSVSPRILYTPAAPGEILSLLLTVSRATGTGTVQMLNSNSIDLYIEDLGADPGDTGTDL